MTLEVVHQPAGGGDHDLRLALELLELGLELLPAVEDGHAEIGVAGQQGAQLVSDLNGELAGRGQDQSLHVLTGGIHVDDHRDAEGKGLAGPGRGLGKHVLPLHKRRDGLGLHRRGQAVALLLQGRKDRLGEIHILKGKIVFHDLLLLKDSVILEMIPQLPANSKEFSGKSVFSGSSD